MACILVFTKPASLNSVDAGFASRKDVKSLSVGTPVLQFDEASGSFTPTQTLAGAGLYFVFDGIAEKTINDLLSVLNKESIYILKHTKPDFEFAAIPGSHIVVGRHAAGGDFYSATVRIVSDTKSEKLRRVFEVIFRTDPVLEAKLALLQKILSGETASPLDIRIKGLQNDVDAFLLASQGKGPFSPEYQLAFETLRDALGIE